jgi:lipopolysaccharide export system protein LptC
MLPFRNLRFVRWSVRLGFFLICGCLAWAGDKSEKTKGAPIKDEVGLKNIPLPIGHEAKGLILPDFDPQGQMRGRFEAKNATRIDQDHVRFIDLKMVTFTEKNEPDLKFDMTDAVLNLDTRVLESKQRTKIKRADFELEGDTMQFDTKTRQGTLVGNVKMIILDQRHFVRKTAE